MIGRYPAKLDDKNRLIVPAKLREELGETFYVTLGVNCGRSCLTVYKESDWQVLNENFNNIPVAQRGGATSLLFMYANECAPDKQFRFSLTSSLMDYAGIERDVVIVGRAGQAEIWAADRFESFEKDNLTPEKLLASLEAIGL